MSKKFRARFIHHLRNNVLKQNLETEKKWILPNSIIQQCFRKEWVVYAKKPFSGVNSVVEYLGRYTQKIAISNHRICNIDTQNSTITFSYKDYKAKGKKKRITLNAIEFIRRFALHILPKAFVRIRHYGILSSSSKQKTIKIICKQLPAKKSKPKKKGANAISYNPLQCPCCKKETMVNILSFDRRGPPLEYIALIKKNNQNI